MSINSETILYQIKEKSTGYIVDKNLTYDEALIWVDNIIGDSYIMEVMKK